MKHFELISEGIDVAPLLSEIEHNAWLWNLNNRRKTVPGSPHAAMSDIWVRYNDDTRARLTGDWTGFNDEHVPVWYQAWEALPSLRPIIFDLMAKVQGEMLGGVLITKIPPGAGIAPHADDSWHVQFFDKFYLSLKSKPGAQFWCDDGETKEALEPKPGEIWLFDNRKIHWVTNESDEDRITLIICIRTERFGRHMEVK